MKNIEFWHVLAAIGFIFLLQHDKDAAITSFTLSGLMYFIFE